MRQSFRNSPNIDKTIIFFISFAFFVRSNSIVSNIHQPPSSVKSITMLNHNLTPPFPQSQQPYRKLIQANNQSNNYTLSFSYAARPGTSLSSSLANIYWNQQLVSSIAPLDYNVHSFSISGLRGIPGMNLLRFQGAGASDSGGLTISQVSLIGIGQNKNLVVNGNFQYPHPETWSIYSKIPYWSSNHNIQVGKGHSYNVNWADTDIRIAQLDVQRNINLTQMIDLNDGLGYQTPQTGSLYNLTFKYAAMNSVGSSLESCEAIVYWNNVQIAPKVSALDYSVWTFSAYLAAQDVVNNLSIVGIGDRDKFGMIIDNVSLTVANPNIYDFQGNEIINGNFQSFLPTNSLNETSQIYSWIKSVSMIVNGSNFNSGLMPTFVMVLGGNNKNYNITQTVTLHMPQCFASNCLKCKDNNSFQCLVCLSSFLLTQGKCLSQEHQIIYSRVNTIIDSPAIVGLFSLPGIRIIFTWSSGWFKSCERLQLYYFNQHQYSQVSSYVLSLIHKKQQKKDGTILNIMDALSNSVSPLNSTRQYLKQKAPKYLDFKKKYISSTFQMLNPRGFSFAKNILFYYLPEFSFCTLFVLVLHILYLILRIFKLSSYVIKYKYIIIIFFMTFQGRLEQSSFYFFAELCSLFSFNFQQKTLNIFIIFFYFGLIFYMFGLILWIYSNHRKQIRHFFLFKQTSLLTISILIAENSVLTLCLGAAHFFGLKNKAIQAVSLSLIEFVLIVCRVSFLSKVKNCHKFNEFSRILTGSIRIMLNASFYFYNIKFMSIFINVDKFLYVSYFLVEIICLPLCFQRYYCGRQIFPKQDFIEKDKKQQDGQKRACELKSKKFTKKPKKIQFNKMNRAHQKIDQAHEQLNVIKKVYKSQQRQWNRQASR